MALGTSEVAEPRASAPAPVRRVLMTADTVGGVWSYSLELSRALGDLGVEVALATMGRSLSRDQWTEASRVPSLEIFESGHKLEWMEDPWPEVDAAGEWLLSLERGLGPDLVHLNGFAHGALEWSVPVLTVAHSCVLSWWQAVEGCDAPGGWDEYRRRVRHGLRGAALVVAPSRAMLDRAQRLYGPLRGTRVIPNGRASTRFPPLAKGQFVLGAGRLWDRAKNLSALAAAAPDLDWPVLLAGEDRHPEGGAVGLEQVCLLGQLSSGELAGWLGRAPIYALPAWYEPFGLTVLEAALAQCTLVLGDIDSLRELWEGVAIFVPPGEPEALSVALQELIRDPGRRDGLARGARRRALSLTPQRMAEGYSRCYRELAEGGSPAGQSPTTRPL